MSSVIINDFKIPYEIARYIVSLVPNRDKSHGRDSPWAEHEKFFEQGPKACFDQMKAGLVLEVTKRNQKPQALHTKYGRWMVLNVSNGDFSKIFRILDDALGLKQTSHSYVDRSFWEIQSWDGQILPKATRKSRASYIPEVKVAELYLQFQKAMQAIPYSLRYQPKIMFNNPDSKVAIVHKTVLPQTVKPLVSKEWERPYSLFSLNGQVWPKPSESTTPAVGWNPLFYESPLAEIASKLEREAFKSSPLSN